MKKFTKIVVAGAMILLGLILLQNSAQAGPPIWSDQPDLPRPMFVDISNNNSGWLNRPEQFHGLKAQGALGAVIKLTQGQRFEDAWAQRYINWARAAGIRVSAYHYCEYDNDDQARAEANHFADVAEHLGLPKDTVMALDVEKNEGMGGMDLDGHRDPTQMSLACTAQLRARGFNNIVYYASGSWIGDGENFPMEPRFLGKTNMWAAAWPNSTPRAEQAQYRDFAAWQFSSRMMFRGVSSGESQVLDASVDYTGRFTGTTAPDAPHPPIAVVPQAPVERIRKTYRADEVQRVFGFLQIRCNELAPVDFDWKDNGIIANWVDKVDPATGKPRDGLIIHTGDRFAFDPQCVVLVPTPQRGSGGLTWSYVEMNGPHDRIWLRVDNRDRLLYE